MGLSVPSGAFFPAYWTPLPLTSSDYPSVRIRLASTFLLPVKALTGSSFQ